jgi:hypothetical protein
MSETFDRDDQYKRQQLFETDNESKQGKRRRNIFDRKVLKATVIIPPQQNNNEQFSSEVWTNQFSSSHNNLEQEIHN